MVVIRDATPADADAVAGLLTQLGYAVLPEEIPGRLERLSRGGVRTLLAVRDGEILGLATMHIIGVLNRARDVAWLTALVVDAASRGAGVGRRLVAEVEARARESGCERLSVTTYESLHGARAFYQRVGLQETGRRFGKAL
ncbi:MAG: GNAT family N-acetyltransferase [Gemmatimonadota bacterium]